MKIKLVSPGWETFSGAFGNVQFLDGVSVDDVTKREADRLAALTRVVTLDGEAVGLQERLIHNSAARAPVLEPLEVQTVAEKEAEKVEDAKVEAAPAVSYSQEDLEKVADAKGIVGLRAIAEPLGVRGRSIVELIKEILVAQSEREDRVLKPAAPAPVEEPAAPEGETGSEEPAADEGESASEKGDEQDASGESENSSDEQAAA